MTGIEQADKNYIAVTGKIFAVLERFIEHGMRRNVTFAEISRELPFSRTTIHRILYSLEKLDYVERSDKSGKYRLAQRFFELTGQAAQFHRLLPTAKPAMQSLLIRYGETVNLGVLDHGMVTHIDVLQSPSAFRIAASPGDRNLIHSTALGKALVAFLPDHEVREILGNRAFVRRTPATIVHNSRFLECLASVRESGVAFDLEENLAGVACVAAPIFSDAAHAIAAISISGPAVRMNPKVKAIKKDVRAAASSITMALRPLGAWVRSNGTSSMERLP